MNILLWIYGEKNKIGLFWTGDEFHSWNEAYAELMKRDAVLKLTYADIGICTEDSRLDIANVHFVRKGGRLIPTDICVKEDRVSFWLERMKDSATA